jgi:hypothetical protein
VPGILTVAGAIAKVTRLILHAAKVSPKMGIRVDRPLGYDEF